MIFSKGTGIIAEMGLKGDRESGLDLGKGKTEEGGSLPGPPSFCCVAGATLFALQRGRDLDTAQTLPVAAEDRLDAVVAGAEPAGHLQLGQGEITLRQ